MLVVRSFVSVFVIEPAVSRFIDTMGRIINWLNLNKNFLFSSSIN